MTDKDALVEFIAEYCWNVEGFYMDPDGTKWHDLSLTRQESVKDVVLTRTDCKKDEDTRDFYYHFFSNLYHELIRKFDIRGKQTGDKELQEIFNKLNDRIDELEQRMKNMYHLTGNSYE